VSEERLGLELRRIREERGLTVEELAEKSGVSATTIRDVERGAREARGDTVAKLAKPLRLTFDEVWELQRRRTQRGREKWRHYCAHAGLYLVACGVERLCPG